MFLTLTASSILSTISRELSSGKVKQAAFANRSYFAFSESNFKNNLIYSSSVCKPSRKTLVVPTSLYFIHVISNYSNAYQVQNQGKPCIYVVDDHGRAPVGTATIDIYQPSKALMRQWGRREEEI